MNSLLSIRVSSYSFHRNLKLIDRKQSIKVRNK